MGALIPLAALAAALLFMGGKKAPVAAPATPKAATTGKIKVTIGPAQILPQTKNEALEAAAKAEKSLGKPKSSASVATNAGVAQVVPGTRLPAGYSRTQASAKAQPLADHVRTRRGKYDRAVVQSFQTAAGLLPDGLYGPQTVAALRYFGAKNVPAALFKGSNTKYAPPAGG